MRKTLAVAILILGIAAATEAQDYTTYRTWSEVVAGIDAKYAKLTPSQIPEHPPAPATRASGSSGWNSSMCPDATRWG